jgi:hypothetical protein
MVFTTVKAPKTTASETGAGDLPYSSVNVQAPHGANETRADFSTTNTKERLRFHLTIFAIAFFIVCSRRPDAILNPQFYAEDGAFFYRDAYHFGLHSLLLTYSGYFQTVVRLIALFARLFPFAWAPLVMNLAATTIQVLPINVFLSSRFSKIAFPIRMMAGLIYLGLPNSFEIDANVTNAHWHLALLGCLILLAAPTREKGWRFFDGFMLFLTSISTPVGILLVAVAAAVWWERKCNGSATNFRTLLPGACLQVITVALHWHGRQTPHINLSGQTILNGGPLGASFHYFAGILGRQVFFSSLFGLKTQSWVLQLHHLASIETIFAVLGLALMLYAFCCAPRELKLFTLFASTVFAMGLTNPLAGTPDHPQWYWLYVDPGCGNRYYFLITLAFLSILIWMSNRKASPRALRCFAVVLLLCLPIGIYRDWRYQRLVDFSFPKFAQKFERVPSGTQVLIPINPGWLMELTKK